MMRSALRLAIVAFAIAGGACGSGPTPPAKLNPNEAACQTCRMFVSDGRFASQIVAPFEEPRFFDDLGCLAHYLKRSGTLPDGAQIYVADHRTKSWVVADRAVFTRLASAAAPMGSPVIAHESVASRDADPDAKSGAPISWEDVRAARLDGGNR